MYGNIACLFASSGCLSDKPQHIMYGNFNSP